MQFKKKYLLTILLLLGNFILTYSCRFLFKPEDKDLRTVINGLVLDTETNMSIDSVIVLLYRSIGLLTVGHEFVDEDTTDIDGRFLFDDQNYPNTISGGPFQIRIRNPNYYWVDYDNINPFEVNKIIIYLRKKE